MSTDRELLEAAAKAAEIDVFWWIADDPAALRLKRNNDLWNPLTDDGDALRLAVRCGISIGLDTFSQRVIPWKPDAIETVFEPFGDDPLAATRRAIVRAAAEIGRSMK